MRVILVHGFTQSADSWQPVIEALPHDFDTIAIEVPEGLDFLSTASGIGARGGPGTYVGYSMGGRLCLALAVERPDLVEELVLVSASPGIADERERAARRAADEQLALDVERDGVDAFLDRWLDQPLFGVAPTRRRAASTSGDATTPSNASRTSCARSARGCSPRCGTGCRS